LESQNVVEKEEKSALEVKKGKLSTEEIFNKHTAEWVLLLEKK